MTLHMEPTDIVMQVLSIAASNLPGKVDIQVGADETSNEGLYLWFCHIHCTTQEHCNTSYNITHSTAMDLLLTLLVLENKFHELDKLAMVSLPHNN